jgi:hypothetical protein
VKMPGETQLEAAEQKSDLSQMSAGYNDEPLQPTETPVAEAIKEPVVETPNTVQLTDEEYQRLMRSATEIDEIKAAQQKMTDTAFGRIGRAIEELKAAGGPVLATVEDFAELMEEYGEDVTDRQVKGLNKVLSKIRGGVNLGPAEIQRVVSQQTEEIRAELIESHLDGVIPDWKQEVKKPEFGEWMAKQDEATKSLAASDRVSDAAKMLRMYASRKTVTAPTQTPKPSVNPRQKRLEAAITPKGSGGHATESESDLDQMRAGYGS